MEPTFHTFSSELQLLKRKGMHLNRVISTIIFIAGCSILVLCSFLFTQCVQIANGNWSEDTWLAQTALYDVLLSEGRFGIKQSEIGGPLYVRVFLYALGACTLIAISSWRLFRNNPVPPIESA